MIKQSLLLGLLEGEEEYKFLRFGLFNEKKLSFLKLLWREFSNLEFSCTLES
jgi:hypothetical protein